MLEIKRKRKDVTRIVNARIEKREAVPEKLPIVYIPSIKVIAFRQVIACRFLLIILKSLISYYMNGVKKLKRLDANCLKFNAF